MPDKDLVVLSIPLRAFAAPDTNSAVEAKLPAGEYPVLNVRNDDPKATYVEVASPQIADGSSWVCIRSDPHVYGRLIKRNIPKPERTSYDADAHSIAETELVTSLKVFSGWNYDRHHPRYPSEKIGGVKLPAAPPTVNNCCTFVEALIAGTFARVHGDAFEWSFDRHQQMMISSSDDLFSPITALIEAGAAVPGPADAMVAPSPWTVFQGWKSGWNDGHTFIAVDYHEPTDKVLILESNCTAELNGVGYRGLGRLAADGLPPDEWWNEPAVWTWDRLASSYPHRHRCHVRVRGRALSRVDALLS